MQNSYVEFQQKFAPYYISVNDLVNYLNFTQYQKIRFNPPSVPPTFKSDIQKIKPQQGNLISRTSGSTGEPVTVIKPPSTLLWYNATNMRELLWRGWDLSKTHVSILARFKTDEKKGNGYFKKLDTISNIQKFLEDVQPCYIYTYPSIIKLLDLTKLTNLIDVKSVGEVGGTSYSSEETGTIALQCPLNISVYHIMENIIVESDPNLGILVTDLTNPLIKRYVLGDIIELMPDGYECLCGRKLKTIGKIMGRVRNMLVLPSGDKIWPTVGEPLFSTITDKIIRHQTIQTDLYNVEVLIQAKTPFTEKEHTDLLALITKSLGQDHLKIEIKYIESFPEGKFEAFKTLLKENN